MLMLLVIILLLIAVGGLPSWPYMTDRGYGWYPSAGALLLIVVVVLLLR